MKKQDLQMEMNYEKVIPEKYKILFEVDWRNGNNCKIDYRDRLELHKLWLEMNKEDCKRFIPAEDVEMIGFIDL